MGKGTSAIKRMFQERSWKIVRGDLVQIMSGKDAKDKKVGTVKKVMRHEQHPKVVVENCNLFSKKVKKTDQNPAGLMTYERPIHYSNVMLLDPVTKKPVRVEYREVPGLGRARVSVGRNASGSVIPKPDILKQRTKPRPDAGAKDTAYADASAMTATAENKVPPFAMQQRSSMSSWTGFALGGAFMRRMTWHSGGGDAAPRKF